MDEDHKLDHLKDGFTQFVADNVGHNTDTVDGKSTFNEISIIACLILSKVIPEKKRSECQQLEAIKRKDSIKLNWYQQKNNTESTQRHQRKSYSF